MRRITARIIFLTGLLFQGVYTVRADQAVQNNLPAKKLEYASKSNQAGKKALTAQPPVTSALEIKGSRPRQNGSELFIDRTSFSQKLVRLKAPDDLSLPNQTSQVKIREQIPLTVEEVTELVERNNTAIKAMGLQVDQSKELLLAAIARWYPTINLSANGLPEYFSIETFRNSKFGGDTHGRQWKRALSLQVRWNLIDPARVPEIAAARDTYEKAKNTYFISLRNVRLNALTQYFLLQQADEGVRIGKESIRASLISLRDAKARFESGVATRLEVLEAETQLARDKKLLTRKLGDQKITRRALASLLNLPPEITPTAATPTQILGLWEASLEESIIAAYGFREELDRLILDISISNSNANSALASIQPILSLVNTYSTSSYDGQTGIATSSSVDMDDNGSSLSNTIGLNATWRIFDGGKARSLYRYHKKKAEEAKADFASTREEMRKEVEESYYNLQTANEDINTSTREVIASREALRLARLRFQAGITTQREVVNNQRDLTQAEVRFTNAITVYNTSLAQLKRRTGIDRIQACEPNEISSSKKDNEKLTDLPIEPYPVIPACKASTIENRDEK